MAEERGRAPDGSPVELYTMLPSMGEVELVHENIAPHSALLELGCGAGRMTRGLVALGHDVVGVDNSAEMLEHVDFAETVLADIATVRLGREFDAVLLASHLVNAADEKTRAAFLRTCRVHMGRAGRLLVQRLDPRWAQPAWAAARGGRRRLSTHVSAAMTGVRVAGTVVSGTIVYQAARRRWEHPFTSHVLDEIAVELALDRAGLELTSWLDPDRTWFLAAPQARRRPSRRV